MKPFEPKTDQPITACIRCCTCCQKGGPSFHVQDRHLIEDGTIHTRYLYTIRKGELVHDNIKGQLKPTTTDIIKIKGNGSSWECVFLNKKEPSCSIYEHRPLECRLLKCWDTREIEAIYEQDRLTRQDILAGIEGLWELIVEHEKHCDPDAINGTLNDLHAGSEEKVQTVLTHAIQYDSAVRQLVLENGNVSPEMIDFLFGRPLVEVLKAAGYIIHSTGGSYRVIKKPPA